MIIMNFEFLVYNYLLDTLVKSAPVKQKTDRFHGVNFARLLRRIKRGRRGRRIFTDPPASPCGSNDRLGALLARMAGAVYTDYVYSSPKAIQLIFLIGVHLPAIASHSRFNSLKKHKYNTNTI